MNFRIKFFVSEYQMLNNRSKSKSSELLKCFTNISNALIGWKLFHFVIHWFSSCGKQWNEMKWGMGNSWKRGNQEFKIYFNHYSFKKDVKTTTNYTFNIIDFLLCKFTIFPMFFWGRFINYVFSSEYMKINKNRHSKRVLTEIESFILGKSFYILFAPGNYQYLWDDWSHEMNSEYPSLLHTLWHRLSGV